MNTKAQPITKAQDSIINLADLAALIESAGEYQRPVTDSVGRAVSVSRAPIQWPQSLSDLADSLRQESTDPTYCAPAFSLPKFLPLKSTDSRALGAFVSLPKNMETLNLPIPRQSAKHRDGAQILLDLVNGIYNGKRLPFNMANGDSLPLALLLQVFAANPRIYRENKYLHVLFGTGSSLLPSLARLTNRVAICDTEGMLTLRQDLYGIREDATESPVVS